MRYSHTNRWLHSPGLCLFRYAPWSQPQLETRLSSHPLVRGDCRAVCREKEGICKTCTTRLGSSLCCRSVSSIFLATQRTHLSRQIHGAVYRPCRAWIPVSGLHEEVCCLSPSTLRASIDLPRLVKDLTQTRTHWWYIKRCISVYTFMLSFT
jgi:hypothetical protein